MQERQLRLINIKKEMTLPPNFSFGLPSVPRSTMPSMFQILSWAPAVPTPPHNHAQEVEPLEQHAAQPCLDNSKMQEIACTGEETVPACQEEPQVVANVSEVKTEYCKEHPPKRTSRSTHTKYQLYEYQRSPVKRSQSQVHCSSVGSKVVKEKTIQPVQKKKLDPTNSDDRQEIEARKQRIKKFELVTRDLPNSAWTTYYGKPTFEAYGRGGSCSQLKSHNVMPHKGANHPKTLQSHYVALIKGQKTKSITHVPRKPIEMQAATQPEKKKEVIYLPLEAPDLINHPRFTALNPQQKHFTKIPSNKYTPVKEKKPQKPRKQRRRKVTRQAMSCDGLKYMNIRERLLEQLQMKKTNASKLAWKVTECYPYNYQSADKLKQSTAAWESRPVAGKASRICDKVGDLIQAKIEAI